MQFRDFLNSLCCCWSIEVGGYLVGILNIICGLIGFILGVLIVSVMKIANDDQNREALRKNSKITDEHLEGNLKVGIYRCLISNSLYILKKIDANIVGWTTLAIFLIHLIISILFVVGLKKVC
jgi:hypothetical protein